MTPIKRGAAAGSGLIRHILVTSANTGLPATGLSYTDFSCYYIRNGEAVSGAITPQDITTIGTYAAPTANTNIRIKKVDDTKMPGVYEIHLHLDWVNTTNLCQSLLIYMTGAEILAAPLLIPLQAFDIQSAGITYLG